MRLSDDQAAQLKLCGVTTRTELMPNGETRFRFVHGPGDECVITTGAGDPSDRSSWSGWQNAHQHGCPFGAEPLVTDFVQGICEVYLVQTGKMIWAEWTGERFALSVLTAGQFVISRPGVAHNALLRPGDTIPNWKLSAARAVSNPDKNRADWWPVPDDLNNALKLVTLEEIAAETGCSLEMLLAS
jgi:hypothetical protein